MPPTQKQSSFAPFIVLTIIDLLFIVLFIVGTILTSDALQPWNATQGTIVGVQVIQCKGTQGAEYAVRFTDRAGQVHTATYQACGYFGVPTNLSPGDSISIIYLPDNPTVIAAPTEPSGNFQFGVCGAIFFGFCQLLILGFWIRAWIRRKRAGSPRVQESVKFPRATDEA